MCSAGNRSRGEAFTFLEVIVVLALVIALLGLATGTLAERSPAPALVASQQSLSALLTLARVEAMASGQTTRVLVATDHPEGGDPDERLRSVQVVRRVADGRWRVISRVVVLPRPALVVPATPPPVVAGSGWSGAPVSSFAGEGLLTVDSAGGTRSLRVGYVEFSPRGTAPVATLVLAPGEAPRLGPSFQPLRFWEPRDVRGIKVSQYGAQTLLDHAAAF
ncbi:MAG TPA: GspH/FimT family pseudopilin [Opitutaceae bacterium]|jgi:hypothetical protein|nr:GspH/FimT family pseudopilin [Opitutaceae bacterium]HRE07712.1 GspH/FimT family pseudopilin [Opitutaceae bacterium]